LSESIPRHREWYLATWQRHITESTTKLDRILILSTLLLQLIYDVDHTPSIARPTARIVQVVSNTRPIIYRADSALEQWTWLPQPSWTALRHLEMRFSTSSSPPMKPGPVPYTAFCRAASILDVDAKHWTHIHHLGVMMRCIMLLAMFLPANTPSAEIILATLTVLQHVAPTFNQAFWRHREWIYESLQAHRRTHLGLLLQWVALCFPKLAGTEAERTWDEATRILRAALLSTDDLTPRMESLQLYLSTWGRHVALQYRTSRDQITHLLALAVHASHFDARRTFIWFSILEHTMQVAPNEVAAAWIDSIEAQHEHQTTPNLHRIGVLYESLVPRVSSTTRAALLRNAPWFAWSRILPVADRKCTYSILQYATEAVNQTHIIHATFIDACVQLASFHFARRNSHFTPCFFAFAETTVRRYTESRKQWWVSDLPALWLARPALHDILCTLVAEPSLSPLPRASTILAFSDWIARIELPIGRNLFLSLLQNRAHAGWVPWTYVSRIVDGWMMLPGQSSYAIRCLECILRFAPLLDAESCMERFLSSVALPTGIKLRLVQQTLTRRMTETDPGPNLPWYRSLHYWFRTLAMSDTKLQCIWAASGVLGEDVNWARMSVVADWFVISQSSNGQL